MDNSYRIKANIGIDQVLNINLKQDIDIYEVLSLKLKQENLYKLHSADYGVIVGRVLANDAFGVPNAKVTVFIPLSDVDKLRQGIRDIYPYNFVTDTDSRNVKFNALPNYKKFDCHQEVGSFPKKQLVLDEDSVLEVYDKYYKYTTITNKAGDYMIFGVPTGEQILHIDVDLSDIGIISQEPRDFIYKGYSIDLFESPTQFKKGTNLDDLPQIQNQNASVTVYPLWGDKNTNEIAITRKDINLQYKFETTCVFLGSVVTDNGTNSIGHNCIPDANVGEAGQLSPSKGNIEMIRKTIDDKVEEYPIKGNQLIDGDGTWCYQIPMNLDYVGMDEYGNIVPTNNPLKGIPTRARVRFRITLDESGEDNLTRHKARYLIPNNPDLYEGYVEPHMYEDVIDKDLYYEFGTLTPEDCFRDLYWNKVYSVKNYIPRVQMSRHEKTSNYLAIKGVNKKNAVKNNPLPFNKLNLNFSVPAYYMLYRYGTGDKGVTGFWRFLKSYAIDYNTDNVRESIIEALDGIGLDFYNDWLNGCLYFPSWFWHIRQKRKHRKGESAYDSVFCECKNKDDDNIPGQLYLYNNCSLVYKNDDLVIQTTGNDDEPLYSSFYDMYTSVPFGSKQFFSGLIRKKINKDGVEAFYYSFGNKLNNEKVNGNSSFNNKFPKEIKPSDGKHYYKYARLFSTDIILLGSLKDCDLDGVPKVGYTMPSTTSNIPPIGRYKPQSEEIIDDEARDQSPSYDDEDIESNLTSHNGMNWGAYWHSDRGFWEFIMHGLADNLGISTPYKYHLGSGLFFGISSSKVYHGSDWATAGLILGLGVIGGILGSLFGTGRHLHRIDIVPRSDLKTCMNAERISELGVTLDSEVNLEYDDIGGSTGYSYVSEMDGLITKREIEDVDSRALFATLNYNKLIGNVENFLTGYKKYDLKYLYPTNFDGRMENIAVEYTSGVTTDDRNKDYLDFKFGNKEEKYEYYYRNISTSYNGKRNKKINNSIIDKKINNVINGNYNEYEIGDGYAKITHFTKPKIRHFYGYNNSTDNVYPLLRNRYKFQNYPYSFPLYDNSFYFFFGLNQGSSAIDKFYEQFYSECPSQIQMPFTMEVSVSGATACGRNNGVIKTNVQEITLPYSIELWRDGVLIDEKNDVNLYINEFTNLINGEYNIVIRDIYGITLTEKVILKYQKITLETNIIRGILTEYVGQTCDEICKNNYHGKLEIKKYTIYGNDVSVNSLDGENGIYKIGTYDGNNIMIEITPKNGNDFSKYICTCTNEKEGNIINFSVPGTFIIKVYEMCGDKISENVSYYNITISDTKKLEMYINNVPLKYLVGYNEDIIPYNKWFHNSGETVNSVTDVSIKGWFGTHNPISYSNLFKNPFETEQNKLLWKMDIGEDGSLDILREKFNFMFTLSNATYVTARGTNKFEVDVLGGDGETLMRSGMPEYDKFSYYNTEKGREFESFITNERKTSLCNEFNPNIVTENYRYVDEVSKFPSEGKVVSGYNFNPKYRNSVNNAANYFAGFSNNANIVQLTPDTCEQHNEYKPYQVIPYKAHDLFKDGIKMCLYDERQGKDILNKVYETNRYFRTEFIDRRFDYDAFFITGHRGIHFDVNNYESEIITETSIWDKGRISALTYNGIEMLSNEDNGKKLIIGETPGKTEYTYKLDTAEVTLDLDSPKTFYESKLYYGDGKYVDLINAYDYLDNPNPKATFIRSDNSSVECTRNTSNEKTGLEFKNFGFNGSDVQGYPSKRWLDYYRVPYGDFYKFHNVSCSYDGINIEQTDKLIKATAVPGEVVDFTVEAGELINLECGGFESDSEKGYFNIAFYGAKGGTLSATTIVNLPFRIDSSGSAGFRSKIGNLGIKICGDDITHSNLNEIKSASTFDICTGTVSSSKVFNVTDIPNTFDTEEEFKNKIFKVENVSWKNSIYKFINIIFDRLYYSQYADSLMKKIRVLNTSTIYNINDFGFGYTGHEIITDETVIPKNAIKVETEGSGTVTPPSEEEEGGTVTIDSTGSNTNNVIVKKEHDYTKFTFTSKFLAHCLTNVSFKIKYEGTETIYKLSESNVGIYDSGDNFITFGVIWLRHNVLLKDTTNKAEIIVYMDIDNEIKSKNGKGHMEFAFGFKIQGEGTTITDDINLV